jgi:hypothetical protein
MNSVLEQVAYRNIITRVNQLQPESERRWGTMTPNQMMCHISDCLRDILGVRVMEPMLPPEVQQQQLRAVVFGDREWDHSLPTLPPYSQDNDGLGTRPTNFTDDRKTLLGLLDQLYLSSADSRLYPHAGLDILSRDEAGIYTWKHLDYHLRQFGV